MRQLGEARVACLFSLFRIFFFCVRWQRYAAWRPSSRLDGGPTARRSSNDGADATAATAGHVAAAAAAASAHAAQRRFLSPPPRSSRIAAKLVQPKCMGTTRRHDYAAAGAAAALHAGSRYVPPLPWVCAADATDAHDALSGTCGHAWCSCRHCCHWVAAARTRGSRGLVLLHHDGGRCTAVGGGTRRSEHRRSSNSAGRSNYKCYSRCRRTRRRQQGTSQQVDDSCWRARDGGDNPCPLPCSHPAA